MLSPTDKVKDYEVIAPLGSGGMAMLYLARRRGVGGFSRLVTLKLVHKHLIEDENIIKLFLDEARISAHVAHPNVVHVEEVGQIGDSYFIAMEYVHGVSLAELLARLTERRLRLRPKFCVWLAAQIAEALHAAHEAKNERGVPLDIVHRDVSPQNVLIGHTGHVKLIDFGIANCQAETDERGGKRTVLGKLRYMSPEQLRLEQTDRRTDVYALGVMLWEMLAGRSLFRCQRFDDERDWATRENPPPPSKYSAHSMPALDRVVLKAIASDPSKRYDSAFQFRAALLRADPSAARLDAPMVAALMRSMLGDELDRRRASWPSEVAGQLEVAPEVTTSQVWSLDELTADISGISPVVNDDDEPANDVQPEEPRSETKVKPNVVQEPRDEDDEDRDPTLAATPTALRSPKQSVGTLGEFGPVPGTNPKLTTVPSGAFSNPASEPRIERSVLVVTTPGIGPLRQPTLHRIPAPAPEAPNDTLRVAPSSVYLVEPMLSARTLRAAVIGSVCLAFGVFIGTFLTPVPAPEPEPAPVKHVQHAVVVPTETKNEAALAPPRDDVHDDSTPSDDNVLTVRVDTKILTDTRDDSSVNVNETGARERHSGGETVHNSASLRKERLSSRRNAWRSAKLANQNNKLGAVPTSKTSSNRKAPARLSHAAD